MQTKYDVYDVLREALARPDWENWLYERVKVDADGNVSAVCYPPSPDGWKAALTKAEFEALKKHLEDVAVASMQTARAYLQESIFKATRKLESQKIGCSTVVLHPSWSAVFQPCKWEMFGADFYFEEDLPQMVMSSSRYGRWVEIFPGETAKKEAKVERRRQRRLLRLAPLRAPTEQR